jgi:hypothetical protein
VNFLLYYGYRCIYHTAKHLNIKYSKYTKYNKDNYDSVYSNIHYSPQSQLDCAPLWSGMVRGVWWRDNIVIYIISALGTLNENTVLPKLLRKCKINYKAHKEHKDIPR